MNRQELMKFTADFRNLLQREIPENKELRYEFFYRITALCYAVYNGVPGLERNFLKDRASFLRMAERMEALFPSAFSEQTEWQALPESLFGENSPVSGILQMVPEDCWKNHPALPGWLHQYYQAEQKQAVFTALKQSQKIAKEDLPAATQLFTPDYIVQYLLQNSLGRLGTEKNAQKPAAENWHYRIPEAEQNPLVLHQLAEQAASCSLPDLKILDPCMGSGHILLSAFQMLMELYQQSGYSSKEAVLLILTRNLYGFDIDTRVVRLAGFSLLMEAFRFDPDILTERPELSLYALTPCRLPEESRFLPPSMEQEVRKLAAFSEHAEEFGSLLQPSGLDFKLLGKAAEIIPALQEPIAAIRLLSEKYDVVVTNPPYMGKKNLNPSLSSFLAEQYPAGKSELYAAFILRCLQFTRSGGFCAMITIHTWMFLRSYQQLRQEIGETAEISTLIHTGAGTFEELNAFNVLSAAFCLRKGRIPGFVSRFVRLSDFYRPEEKILHFQDEQLRFDRCRSDFDAVPGKPLVYWISGKAMRNFTDCRPLRELAAPKQGMATADNRRFVRYWYEVPPESLCLCAENAEKAEKSGCRWFPYNKGGFFRKWYGMNEYVVDWENNGKRLRESGRAVLRNQTDYFKSGITWSLFGFENFAVRYKEAGFLFDVSGSSVFPKQEDTLYLLAFLASKVSFFYLSVLAPTVNFQVGNIGDLPFGDFPALREEIRQLAAECISISQEDWNESELSWDFTVHPWVRYRNCGSLADAADQDRRVTEERYERLKKAEERINTLFIRAYHLEDEMDPEVSERDIALRRFKLSEEAKSFLSYAAGCILGRHEQAEGEYIFSEQKLAVRVTDWLKRIFGQERSAENIRFLASALAGRPAGPEEIIRYFADSFYKDHRKRYQKHPVYWKFSSGKRHGFTAFVYLHRMEQDIWDRLVSLCQEQIAEYQAEGVSAKEKQLEAENYCVLLENYRKNPPCLDRNEGTEVNMNRIAELLGS